MCKEGNQLKIYKRCIKQVAIQMYKIKNQLSPSYVQSLFTNRESNYDMRDNDRFTIPNFNTVTYGKKSLRYYGAKLWTDIPTEIKERFSLENFKSAVTIWLENIDDESNINFL